MRARKLKEDKMGDALNINQVRRLCSLTRREKMTPEDVGSAVARAGGPAKDVYTKEQAEGLFFYLNTEQSSAIIAEVKKKKEKAKGGSADKRGDRLLNHAAAK